MRRYVANAQHIDNQGHILGGLFRHSSKSNEEHGWDEAVPPQPNRSLAEAIAPMWTDTRKYSVKGLKEAAIAVGGWGITSIAAHPGYESLFTSPREARITIPKQRGTCTSLERALPWVSIVARVPTQTNYSEPCVESLSFSDCVDTGIRYPTTLPG